jgi:hypothetical protein
VIECSLNALVEAEDRQVEAVPRGTGSNGTSSAMDGLENAVNNAKALRNPLKRTNLHQSGDSGDASKKPCTWSSEEELTVMQHLRKMQEKDRMGTGEFKYGPIAVAMNKTFMRSTR